MVAGSEFMATAVELTGSDDVLGVVKIETLRTGDDLAIEAQFETAIIMGLGADEGELIGTLLLDRQGDREAVARLGIGPPEVVVAAPPAGLELGHRLVRHPSAGLA